MTTTRSYEYYEVRACIETEHGRYEGEGQRSIQSYASPDKYKFALNRVAASGHSFETFWSLYGRLKGDDGVYIAECIGDFDTMDDAYAVMDAILAPLQQIIDNCGDDMDTARSICEDIINKSSNSDLQ